MTEKVDVRTREIVLGILLETETGKQFSHRIMRDVLQKYDYLRGQEKAFIKRLAEGTLERRIELDYFINQISSVPVQKMKPLIRCLLRMGVYQILYMDAVPDSAACNEAVKLAGKRGFHNLKGFVNGVLRKIASEKENLLYPHQGEEPVLYLSVRYSMPEWIVNMWITAYGEEETEQLLYGLLEERPVMIRFASWVTEMQREQWLAGVREKGIEAKQHPYLTYAYCLKGVEGVMNLPGYQDGVFAVQDISSMLAVEAADIKPGNLVLDICAAPGGKAMLAAEKAYPEGSVTARDLSAPRAAWIEENIQRMKLENVDVQVWDATILDEAMRGKADVVLADVPCSGLGVIGRKQDIKYHVSEQSLRELTEVQKDILLAAAAYVKEGGILLYSTCTINPAENEEMVQWICKELPFELEGIQDCLPRELKGGTVAQGYLQLLPGKHQSDGFFFAKLRRKE